MNIEGVTLQSLHVDDSTNIGSLKGDDQSTWHSFTAFWRTKIHVQYRKAGFEFNEAWRCMTSFRLYILLVRPLTNDAQTIKNLN